MRQFDNPFNLSKQVVAYRIMPLDDSAEIEIIETNKTDGTPVTYISINSSLAENQLNTLFERAETAEEITYFANAKIDRQAIKDAYLAMITRLDQIQNAGSIPFTAAGFGQVVQAVKDEALYIERIMKVLKNLIT